MEWRKIWPPTNKKLIEFEACSILYNYFPDEGRFIPGGLAQQVEELMNR